MVPMLSIYSSFAVFMESEQTYGHIVLLQPVT